MGEQVQILWSDYPLNRWMVLFTIILMLLILNRFIGLFPYLINTLFDWKANIRLESSIPRVRTRNFIAFCMVFPLCLITGRYSLVSMETLKFIPDNLSFLAILVLVSAFYLLKIFMYVLLLPGNHTRSSYKAALSSEPNTFILLVIAELVTIGILTVFHICEDTIRTVILYELGVFFLILVVRKGQILSSACNPFSTFLYLCGLEFLPAAILIMANLWY